MEFRRATQAAAIVLLSLWIASCVGWFDSRTYWESGGYRLVAIDDPAQNFLNDEDGSQLIGPTVFAVGDNSSYIVVKQHPEIERAGYFFSFDRSVTNYYIVERIVGDHIDRRAGVRGPLSESEFMALREEMSLPEFSKTFSDLE